MAAPTFIDSLNGQVRLAGDPTTTNYFPIDFAGSIGNGAEFSGSFTNLGVQYDVSADVQPFGNQINLRVALHQIVNGSAPPLVFTFSNIQFNPNSQVAAGGYVSPATPGAFGAVTMPGSGTVQVNTNTVFLSNGGSYGGALYITTALATPEPGTASLTALGIGATLIGAARLRRKTKAPTRERL